MYARDEHLAADDDAFGPFDDEPDQQSCGCPLDYHLSDCPILTERRSMQDPPDPDDWYERGEW